MRLDGEGRLVERGDGRLEGGRSMLMTQLLESALHDLLRMTGYCSALSVNSTDQRRIKYTILPVQVEQEDLLLLL